MTDLSIAASAPLAAPFPWFGGKARIAGPIWERLGPVTNYVEPFYGSGAIHLQRPRPFHGPETINDADGFVANAWRALADDPLAVAGRRGRRGPAEPGPGAEACLDRRPSAGDGDLARRWRVGTAVA